MPRPTRELQLRYQREQYTERRAHYFAAAGSRCASCGKTSGTPLGFEADHVDPSTKVTNAFWSWKIERLESELMKCQWLCTACHRAKTDAGRLADHGNYSRYRGGCRCSLCRNANTAKRQNERSKKSDEQQIRERESARLRMRRLRAR